MIETIIYIDWIKNQVMTQFGSLKIDNEEDTVMCSHDNMIDNNLVNTLVVA